MDGIGPGFSSTAVLIVAIGTERLRLAPRGCRREIHHGRGGRVPLSDAVLINVGVWGMGTAAATPRAGAGARVFGALYLIVYAWRSLQRAWSPQALAVDAAHQRTRWPRCWEPPFH